MISFNSSFANINVVVPDWKTFFWIEASVADVTAVNPKGTKMLLANGLSTFPINGKPSFIKVPKILPENSPYCTILDSWVFEKNLLAVKSFLKALQIFQTCVLVNNNLCGILVSLLASPVIFDERFRVTLVSFSIPDFNLLSCELGNVMSKVL